MAISETQSLILSQAAQHEAGLATAPKGLPAGARNAVFRSMLKNKLVTEINAPRAYVGLGWRQDEAGSWVALRITDDGLRAIGIDPNEGDTVAHGAAGGAGSRGCPGGRPRRRGRPGRAPRDDRGGHRARTRPAAGGARCRG